MHQTKTFYEDINYIRLLLILLLVFYHAFAPFGGAWESIYPGKHISAYWWLDKLSYAFMLESFVFISGFLFGNQACKALKSGGHFNYKNGFKRQISAVDCS